jgi:hypothetical protein
MAIPAAVGISLVQMSLYDVKGGNRAVIFDRLSGVKDTVCYCYYSLTNDADCCMVGHQ